MTITGDLLFNSEGMGCNNYEIREWKAKSNERGADAWGKEQVG
jgi:hypothetical protein